MRFFDRSSNQFSFSPSQFYRSSFEIYYYSLEMSIEISSITSTQNSRELMQLKKIYRKNEKFNNIDNNLQFKLIMFYSKCRRANVSTELYFETTSIMLLKQTLIALYSNQIVISIFQEFIWKMQMIFENLEWQKMNLAKCVKALHFLWTCVQTLRLFFFQKFLKKHILHYII